MLGVALATFAREIILPVPLIVMVVVFSFMYYVAAFVRPKLGWVLLVDAGAVLVLAFFVFRYYTPAIWLNFILALLLAASVLLLLFGRRTV